MGTDGVCLLLRNVLMMVDLQAAMERLNLESECHFVFCLNLFSVLYIMGTSTGHGPSCCISAYGDEVERS